MSKFKPMLACASPKDHSKIKFPTWASPKLDGIRCVIRDGKALSRSLKPISNIHTRTTLEDLNLPNLDGELMIKGSTNFSDVSSAIMSRSGWPAFEYHVFDIQMRDPQPYRRRYRELKYIVTQYGHPLILVEHWIVPNAKEMLADESYILSEGYEGLMLRDPDSPYKFGRSTVREGYLMKLKRFHDDEAEVIGASELMHNENVQMVNAVGYAERSMSKENLVPAGILGKLQVRWKGVEFGIGSGFDAATRRSLWDDHNASLLAGRIVKFKYFEVGSKGAPRFPIFLGFCDPLDK